MRRLAENNRDGIGKEGYVYVRDGLMGERSRLYGKGGVEKAGMDSCRTVTVCISTGLREGKG